MQTTAPVQPLESVFQRIQRERMQDVPLLNSRLTVEAVGFRPSPIGWVGVLITPWFINLVLLPSEQTRGALDDVEAVGRKTLHLFPAGRFEFIISYEPDLGPFEMCSMFSPVQEFPNQETARHAAQSAIDALFAEPPSAGTQDGARNPWSPEGAPASERSSHPTRRGFLFGAARRTSSADPGAP